MNEKAKISWTLRQEGEKLISGVEMDVCPADILIGLKALFTETIKTLSEELGVSEAFTRELILQLINKEEDNE